MSTSTSPTARRTFVALAIAVLVPVVRVHALVTVLIERGAGIAIRSAFSDEFYLNSTIAARFSTRIGSRDVYFLDRVKARPNICEITIA